MRQGPQETLHFHPWNELPAESKLSEISSSELRSVQKGVRVTTETPARVAPFSKRIQSSSGTNLNSKWSITAGIFHVCLSYRTTLLPLKKILLGHRGGSFAFGSGHDPPHLGAEPRMGSVLQRETASPSVPHPAHVAVSYSLSEIKS